MKYLFFILILANLVFFLWENGFRPESGGPRELALPRSAPERLELLSERSAPPDEIPPSPGEEAAASEEVPPVDLANGEMQNAEAQTPVSAPTEEEADARPAEEPKSRNCFKIGPYSVRQQAQEALELVRTHVEKAERVVLSGGVPDGWWVLFPKAASMEAARENRRMLLEKGVQDLWLFDKGELAGAISLGLYSIHDGALRAQADFTKKNIVTDIVPRLVPTRAEWVRVPWKGSPLELEELIHLLNSEGGETRLPAPQACD